MTVKVKQDALMEAFGSQGWAWLTLLQSQPAKMESRWVLASPPAHCQATQDKRMTPQWQGW